MAKRMKSKRSIPFRHVFVFSVLMFIGVTVWGLWIINAGIKPVLINIAKNKAKQVANYGINYGIKKKEAHDLEKYMQVNQLVNITKNNDGDITSMNYNTPTVNKLLAGTQSEIQKYLRSIEDGTSPIYGINDSVKIVEKQKGVIANIPLGQATNNVLLSNLGPKVPVKFELISNVQTDIVGKVEQYPINNIWIQILIHVEVEVQTVIPFSTKPFVVKSDIPIAQDFIPGKVPMYWGGGNGDNASFVLPSPKKNSSSTEKKKN